MVSYIKVCDACHERDPVHAHDCPLREQAPFLVPSSAAFAGLAGDVVRAMEPHTEADPAALLLNTLACFGAMVGPMAETEAGSAKHPPAIFAAFVGRSSRSRKGTAEREVSSVMRRVEDGWDQNHRVGGFGSGEAFIQHAAEHPGDALYLVESEFAKVLASTARDASSASSVLRQAWDFQRLEHRIRKQAYDAPAAPVSLIAHITADELRDSKHGLRLVDVMNGFGNRVLWCYVDRRQVIPNLEPLPGHVRDRLVAALRSSLDRARCAGVVRRSPPANDLWVDLYGRMAQDDPAGIVGALTARAEAQVLRLSLIYALIDGMTTIEPRHLESAWEVWRYCRWSSQHIWVGSGSGDPDVDRVAAILEAGEELSSTSLDRMFHGHKDIPAIRRRVVDLGIAEEVVKPTGGRPAKVLTLAEKAVKAEKARAWWIGPDFFRSTADDVSAGHAVLPHIPLSPLPSARSRGQEATDGDGSPGCPDSPRG
jgi:hypothetical protein